MAEQPPSGVPFSEAGVPNAPTIGRYYDMPSYYPVPLSNLVVHPACKVVEEQMFFGAGGWTDRRMDGRTCSAAKLMGPTGSPESSQGSFWGMNLISTKPR